MTTEAGRSHRPIVFDTDVRADCRVCGRPCCWVTTGWDARPPDGEPVSTGYWRHAREP